MPLAFVYVAFFLLVVNIMDLIRQVKDNKHLHVLCLLITSDRYITGRNPLFINRAGL